ncbi:hypothetical protein LJR168_001769 [Pseudoxanthomonas sp. LjRoot168]|uniref:hypothetical protein n=1 Tax=unclassified Pseudoxanthomonas TaxID=2645906 RepID=UPI003ECF0E8D
MSILNVLFQDPQTAFVGVDSQVTTIEGGGKFSDTNKLLLIPAAATIIACRGEQTLARWTMSELVRRTGGMNFDDMPSIMPSVLETCHAEALRQAKAAGIKVDRLDAELALVGYSEQAARVLCMHFTRQAGQANFAAQRRDNGVLSPPLGKAPASQGPDQFELQRCIASAQTAEWKAKCPADPIGGRLVVARVTKGEVTVRNLGTI